MDHRFYLNRTVPQKVGLGYAGQFIQDTFGFFIDSWGMITRGNLKSHTLHGLTGNVQEVKAGSHVWQRGVQNQRYNITWSQEISIINIFPGTSPLDSILGIDHTLYSASRKNSAPSTWNDSGTVPGIRHFFYNVSYENFSSQLCDFQKLRASLLGFTAGFFRIG